MSEQYYEEYDERERTQPLAMGGVIDLSGIPLVSGDTGIKAGYANIQYDTTTCANPFTFAVNAVTPTDDFLHRGMIQPKTSIPSYTPTTPPLTEERIAEIVRKVVQEVLYPDVSEQVTDASQYRRIVLYEEDRTAWQGMLYRKSGE